MDWGTHCLGPLDLLALKAHFFKEAYVIQVYFHYNIVYAPVTDASISLFSQLAALLTTPCASHLAISNLPPTPDPQQWKAVTGEGGGVDLQRTGRPNICLIRICIYQIGFLLLPVKSFSR